MENDPRVQGEGAEGVDFSFVTDESAAFIV